MIVVIGIGVCFSIMVGLYSLPTNEMIRHAKQTENIYSSDGGVSNWADDGSTLLDTYTDSLMINIALSSPYDSIVENAMRNAFFVADKYTANEPQGNLVSLLDGDSGHYVSYENYWHGYLLLFKPLLLFFNIAELREVMMFIQFSLIVLTEILLYRKNTLYPIAFAPVLLFINPITTVMSFQFADILIISLLIMDYMLLFNERLNKRNRYEYLFLTSGMMVAFFDFFTYPIVAFGLPAVLMLMLNKSDAKNSFLSLLKCGIAWIFGYGGLWFGKWITAFVSTGVNSIGQAFHSVAYRSNIEGLSYFYVLQSIKSAINLKTLVLIAVMIAFVWSLGIIKRIRTEGKIAVAPLLFSLVVGLAPFVWYFVVRNHSALHPWMEYRELAIAVWAISAAGTLYIRDKENYSEGNI